MLGGFATAVILQWVSPPGHLVSTGSAVGDWALQAIPPFAIAWIVAFAFRVWIEASGLHQFERARADDLQALLNESRETVAAPVITHDTWLLDAIYFIVKRRWPSAYGTVDLVLFPNLMSQVWQKQLRQTTEWKATVTALNEVRQKAFDGELKVWGVPNAPNKIGWRRTAGSRGINIIAQDMEIVGDTLLHSVPNSHWASYEVSPLDLPKPPHLVHTTARDLPGLDQGSFASLKVSKVQVEKLWPV